MVLPHHVRSRARPTRHVTQHDLLPHSMATSGHVTHGSLQRHPHTWSSTFWDGDWQAICASHFNGGLNTLLCFTSTCCRCPSLAGATSLKVNGQRRWALLPPPPPNHSLGITFTTVVLVRHVPLWCTQCESILISYYGKCLHNNCGPCTQHNTCMYTHLLSHLTYILGTQGIRRTLE